MSPYISAAKRAAGSNVTDEVKNSRPAKWTCSECKATGQEASPKSAARALDHHIYQEHGDHR